jgi:hypothetical protein
MMAAYVRNPITNTYTQIKIFIQTEVTSKTAKYNLISSESRQGSELILFRP